MYLVFDIYPALDLILYLGYKNCKLIALLYTYLAADRAIIMDCLLVALHADITCVNIIEDLQLL